MATPEKNVEIDDDRKCDHCNAHNKSLFKCGGCKQVFYCNRKCQLVAWKCGHKQICKYTSELESIHQRLSIEYDLTSQSKKTKEISKITPLEFKKITLRQIIWWFDLDQDKGLNFNEYQDMISNLPPKILEKIINAQSEDAKWTKWCKLCERFGFEDPYKTILTENEIWAILLEIGTTMTAKLKNKQTKNDNNNEPVATGYQHAFYLLVILRNVVKDGAVAPISKQEISEAVMCVTPLSTDITFIIYAYLSNIDAIFKIGKDKFPVQWEHNAEDIKPLHVMLQKYKETSSTKNKVDQENKDNDDYIHFNWDQEDDDDKKDDEYNKLYQYDVTYLRGIQEVLYSDGRSMGDAEGIEINIRMIDEFGIIDKEKKSKQYTFHLGSTSSAKLYGLFDLENHAELISCVLKQYGLDPINIQHLYIGKDLFGDDVRTEMQQKLVKTFNDMNGCNARWMNQMRAAIIGLFSADVYNKKQRIQK